VEIITGLAIVFGGYELNHTGGIDDEHELKI